MTLQICSGVAGGNKFSTTLQTYFRDVGLLGSVDNRRGPKDRYHPMRVLRLPAQAVPLIIGLFAIPALSQGLESKRFPHDIAERQRYSDIVCSATILKISKAGNPIKVEGEERIGWKYNSPPRGLMLDESNVDVSQVLAKELVFAVQSAPHTIGRLATHYYSWTEELIGRLAIRLVEPFLSSSDPLIRYQAAWWLSFREVNNAVINELTNAMRDESIEEWARSGARERLGDMAAGRYVPAAQK